MTNGDCEMTNLTADYVANFFIDLANKTEYGLMTHERLNLLLYVAQGHSFKRLGHPLFTDEFLMGDGWPFVETLYNWIGSDPLAECRSVSPRYTPEVFAGDETEFLLDVAREYGDTSDSYLVGVKKILYDPLIGAIMIGECPEYLTPSSLVKGYCIIPKSAIKKTFMNKDLPKFELNISKDEIVGYHDEEGHLVGGKAGRQLRCRLTERGFRKIR